MMRRIACVTHQQKTKGLPVFSRVAVQLDAVILCDILRSVYSELVASDGSDSTCHTCVALFSYTCAENMTSLGIACVLSTSYFNAVFFHAFCVRIFSNVERFGYRCTLGISKLFPPQVSERGLEPTFQTEFLFHFFHNAAQSKQTGH